MADNQDQQDTSQPDQAQQGQGDNKGQGNGKGDGNGAPPKKRSRLGFVIFGAVVLVGAILGGLHWYTTRNQITTDDAYTDGRAVSVSPRVSGQVTALLVTDNQVIRAGTTLIRIDPRDFETARRQSMADLESARAQLGSAVANLSILKVTEPAKLEAARANLASARATETNARADYRRFHSIDPAATTRQDIDSATATNSKAAASVAQAEAQVHQAETVDLTVQQAQAQIGQLQAQVLQAQAKLAQANLNLGYTIVRAAQPGSIAKRNVEIGSYVQAGTPVLTLVTPDVWITANFKEDQLARMRPGQRVRVLVDAYPSLKLEGHIDSVQLGSGSHFSAFPAENATGNFVKIVQRVPVKIVIDRGTDPNLPLPLGISVEPTVFVK